MLRLEYFRFLLPKYEETIVVNKCKHQFILGAFYDDLISLFMIIDVKVIINSVCVAEFISLTKKPLLCSANVFGVSTESMQLSFDCRGNSVPIILLLMQRHLYVKGGLQVCDHIYRYSAIAMKIAWIIQFFLFRLKGFSELMPRTVRRSMLENN